MIDFKQIEAFIWVAELGGFSAAAEKLNTTQPSISQRIASFERELSTRVFDRGARGIKLTDKGHELLPHAQRLLDQRNEMLHVAQSTSVIQGTFHLGVAETLVHTWLPLLIEQLYLQYPALNIEIHVDTSQVLKEKLLNYQLDLAFFVGKETDNNTEYMPIGEYALAWVASPNLKLPKRQLRMSDLGVYPVITYPVGSLPYRIVTHILRDAKVPSPRIYGSASLSTIIHMTSRGMGVSLLAKVLVEDLLSQGKLRLLDVDQPLPALEFYAHWLKSPDSHAARTVARLAQHIAEDFTY
ncbi:DNA-binding transcriptional LysR family regulator [Paenalcaligenes hominis]|uniref:DNA-binding transcriptional LysR family regulator n=1 Tax=Paenalcaligenes hominis TaxID=643674 RepID=A0ABX0WRW6_9BURK|nr:LysR family transcriptional regulator [Paenalcaligenes hominis]NJB65508.1 DNA-binding transcriptional LysR family regulator [Paenalcaligenes hominis]GGE65293.1 LysR family transcriptional regulator [Paenalcaligenes hominis]